MTGIYIFTAGAVLAFAVSLATVLLLRPHLARLLEELCGSSTRANFWVAFSSLTIALLGLLTGTARYGYPGGDHLTAQDLFFGLVTQFRGCLIGLLVSLLLVATILLGFIRLFEQALIPPSPCEDQPSSSMGGELLNHRGSTTS